MGPTEVIDLSSDDENERVSFKAVKLEADLIMDANQHDETGKGYLSKQNRSQSHATRKDSEENISSNAPSTGHSNSSVVEQGLSSVDDTGISYASTIGAAPLCRQFWKAGNYDDGLGSKVKVQNAKNYLHVHPMFLHSNATSHKWAFGAIAELLDNSVDEIQNGATFVIVDKISNPSDRSPALLIQDDGGGMDPEAMRRCMSFGFSDKNSQFAIGRYGNGFKTSTMRLGADVIVFTRHLNNGILTQSIGLLSYTYLTRTHLDRIVVPMVNYEFNTSTGSLEILNGKEHFMSNLSMLLRWSPYSSEADLLKQFDGIGSHGTKVIVYNLWCGDDGSLELDFETDPTDIQLAGDIKKTDTKLARKKTQEEDIQLAGDIKKTDTKLARKKTQEEHIATRFRYSLNVYLSILYLRIPENFQIILRGKVVKAHNIADDLKYPEYILYRPQTGGSVQATIVTTIGFLKEAPMVNIHGFNVYHKNRLILPFWQVVSFVDSRGRGVVGVLQADFVEPTHNKQDFERTSLFQKLEVRLKEMTWEYWDHHCTLLGYQDKRKLPRSVNSLHPSLQKPLSIEKPVVLNQSSSLVVNRRIAREKSELPSSNLKIQLEQGSHNKRKSSELVDLQNMKRHASEENVTGVGFSQNNQTITTQADQVVDQETANLMQENKRLHARCSEFEKTEKELNFKVTSLRSEIVAAQGEYNRLLAELKSLEVNVKEE